MVTGWRRAFCTSTPKAKAKAKAEADPVDKHSHSPITTSGSVTPTKTPRFSFFSSSPSPSTWSALPLPPSSQPVSTTAASASLNSGNFSCKTPPSNSPRVSSLQRCSPPCSPRSPSAFSLLLKNSLRLSKHKPKSTTRCGICSHTVNSGQGTAIFTAECSHSFHFPCIATCTLHACPLCGFHWKQSPFLSPHNNNPNPPPPPPLNKSPLYDDDEPLMSPVSGIRFNPIPESDQEADTDTDTDVEFPGFYSHPVTPRPQFFHDRITVDVRISPDAAVVAVGRSYETYALLLTIKAPPSPPSSRRPSVDLVCILDVGGDMTIGKLQALKRAMRAVISSLSSNDRLSIVAFSAASNRLLPLRRMTPTGRRSARKLIDALNVGQGSCVNDAIRKAAKIIQDRKENNHFATIILLDGQDDNHNRRFQHVSSTHLHRLEIPIHTFRVGEELYDEAFLNTVNKFLSVVVLDLRIQLGLASGSAPAEIAAVYSCTNRPALLNAGLAKLGDFYREEEREILVELKVPSTSIGSNHLISARSFHKEPCTKQLIYGGDQSIFVPRPHTIRSPEIQRLRCLFIMTRAVAESRRLIGDRNDIAGAERLLASARAVLGQSNLKFPAVEDCRRRVEAELAEVRWRRQEEKKKREKEKGGGCCVVDEKGEALTPTSAWKAAERLAKLAIMRKSLNRVSDLHGFEDARF